MSLHDSTEVKTAPARATPQRAPATKITTETDYVGTVAKTDQQIATQVTSNPIYKIIITGTGEKEQRIAAAEEFLLRGVEDGSATEEDLDRRQHALSEINAYIQMMRTRLSVEQAREITNQKNAEFQRIQQQATEDVQAFAEELDPLGQLTELLQTFGADGNLADKINAAKQQKAARERRRGHWNFEHAARVDAAQATVRRLEADIQRDKKTLEAKWLGKASLQAQIANNEIALQDAKDALKQVEAEEFVDPVAETNSDVGLVDESILRLQDLGSPEFSEAIHTLRDHSELTIAKIVANFDQVIASQTGMRQSFITMDRTATDAIFALSVLEVAVQRAQAKTKSVAEALIAKTTEVDDSDTAKLSKMENEQRANAILRYSTSLTDFDNSIGIAVTSLTGSQAVIQNILRINAQALKAAELHKVTGVANTADAVTIVIGSILDACNRGAGRVLADALASMRKRAQDGAARIAEGSTDGLQLEVDQLQQILVNVQSLKETTKAITGQTVELLSKERGLMQQMREATGELADASTDAQRTNLHAQAGVVQSKEPEQTKDPAAFSFRLR